MINNAISGSIQSGPSAAQTSSQTAGSVSNTSSGTSSGSTAYGLEKGQIIKGEVVDLKNNEVSVRLSDGQILNGRLTADANILSIGSRVSFRVEDATSQTLTLKILPESSASYLATTIDAALEAASLSKLAKNRSLVAELLSSRMSIDKNNLMLFAKQMSQFPDASIKSLIFLNQNNLPVNKTSVELTEGFLNSNGKMMDNLAALAENISKLPWAAAGQDNNQALLRMLLEDRSALKSTVPPDGLINSPNTVSDNTANTQSTLPMQPLNYAPDLPIGTLLSPEERALFADSLNSLSPAVLDNTKLDELLNGTLSASSLSEAAKLLKEHTPNPAAENLTDKIINAANAQESSTTAIREVLTLESRANLFKLVQSLPEDFPRSFSENIMKGSISVSDFLGQIGSLLSSDTGTSEEHTAALQKLTSSKEFQSLLNSKLLSDWSLTPEDLAKPEAVKTHYENLLRQLEDIKTLTESGTFTGSQALQSQLAHVTDSVQYMNMFQHMFSYLQLPVKLKNQYAESELYVYSNKKSNLDIAEGVRVVLHLKMDNLGPVDIAVDLTRSQLKNTFYLDSKEALDLLSSHMGTLEERLTDKGYQVSTEFFNRDKSSEPLGKSLIESTLHTEENTPAPSSEGKRYHFDIRA